MQLRRLNSIGFDGGGPLVGLGGYRKACCGDGISLSKRGTGKVIEVWCILYQRVRVRALL